MSKDQVKEVRVSYSTTVERVAADTPVTEMTVLELEMLIQSALKEALQEILGDPDVGLELRPEFEERLHQATIYVASGGRLLSMEELTSQLEEASGV